MGDHECGALLTPGLINSNHISICTYFLLQIGRSKQFLPIYISTMVFKCNIPPENKALARLLILQGNLSLREIAQTCDMSKTSVGRLSHMMTKSSNSTLMKKNNRKSSSDNAPSRSSKIGRPKKLTVRAERYVMRELKKLRSSEGSFSIARLMTVTGLSQEDITIRSVSNLIRRNGYGLYQARKKGLLSKNDLKVRVKFARRMLKRPDDFWCNDVAFYLDAISFIYKTNPHDQARSPKSKIYRKPSEGLSPSCTARGNKEGTGGRTVRLVVAITYKKGVLVCEPYKKMNGEYFKTFVRRNFKAMFKASGKDSLVFVQDGDPSQNSAVAKAAMAKCKAQILSIPPRSPDINPIENYFHLVRRQLQHDALHKNITHESMEQFQDRIIDTMRAIPQSIIDKTIKSIPNRLAKIIEGKGQRTKY